MCTDSQFCIKDVTNKTRALTFVRAPHAKGGARAGRLYCGWSECVHGNSKTKARVAQIQLSTAVMEDLSEEHQALYTWIDEIPLTRQKKHVARDFSDGGNT